MSDGWGDVAKREKEKQEALAGEMTPDMASDEEMIEFNKSVLIAPLIANELLSEIRDLLVEVVNEMRKANALASQEEYKPIEAREPEEYEIPEMDIPVGLEDESERPKPKLETEEEVVNYIKDILTYLDDDGWKLTKEQIDKFEIGVEKDKVVVKAPWIGKEHFRAFVGFMEEEFQAEYNSTNWHFVLPRP